MVMVSMSLPRNRNPKTGMEASAWEVIKLGLRNVKYFGQELLSLLSWDSLGNMEGYCLSVSLTTLNCLS